MTNDYRDPAGVYWQRDEKTGVWHYHDGSTWTPSQAPPPGLWQPTPSQPRKSRRRVVIWCAVVGILAVNGVVLYLERGGASTYYSCNTSSLSVQRALAVYKAKFGSYPTPPRPWSESNYSSNFSPLLKVSAKSGLFALTKAPDTNKYVIEYDSLGHVWVERPGTYRRSNDARQDFSTNLNVCSEITGTPVRGP